MEIICFVHEIGPPCINLRVSIFVIRTLTESTHINTCWANFIHKTYDFHIFLDDWAVTMTVSERFRNGWNLLEKREPYREAFLYKKALKTDICAVRFALTALFSFKK
jgi:hypothetical protein